MAPKLSGGIDHVHVYVRDRGAAAGWFASVLGFEPVAEFAAWADDPDGPLTLKNPEDTIHVALFRSDKPAADTIAFGASGSEFVAWREHLQARSVPVRLTDHGMACSLYFGDPDGNVYEITTYDPDFVRRRLADG